MTVEITIPCYNEAHRLEGGFSKLSRWLEANPLTARDISIVIAVNGSTDATLEIARRLAPLSPVPCRVRAIERAGLALALRDAWDTSTADIVGYADTDMATDLAHIPEVIARFQAPGVVAVNGSRWLPASVVGRRSLKRRACSRLLRLGIGILTGIRATDIACGFKFFRRDWYGRWSGEVFSEQFFLGGELLYLAQCEGPGAVVELPLRWTDQPGSRINIKSAMLSYWDGIRKLNQLKRRLAQRRAAAGG
ncbi:MAG: glycosyltransferase [Puniceicoccales bacterium]|jgi:glycosyltransferase involved in cell wall biosynthesis|nr:glycosyltransferase [Puniceicoccales bacterium]